MTGAGWSLSYVLTASNPLSNVFLCDSGARTLKTKCMLGQLVLPKESSGRKVEKGEERRLTPVSCLLILSVLSVAALPQNSSGQSGLPKCCPLCSNQQYSLPRAWAQLCQSSPLSFWSAITWQMASIPQTLHPQLHRTSSEILVPVNYPSVSRVFSRPWYIR